MRKRLIANRKPKDYMNSELKEVPPIVCVLCDKMFDAMPNLTDHMSVHENNFEGDCCNNKFNTKHDLNSHVKANHGRYLFIWKCQYSSCEMILRKQADLCEHMRSQHFGPLANIIHKNYQCVRCLDIFSKRKMARTHSFQCSGLKTVSMEIERVSTCTRDSWPLEGGLVEKILSKGASDQNNEAVLLTVGRVKKEIMLRSSLEEFGTNLLGEHKEQEEGTKCPASISQDLTLSAMWTVVWAKVVEQQYQQVPWAQVTDVEVICLVLLMRFGLYNLNFLQFK